MRSHTFETPGHVRLEVEVESGSVDVTTGVTPVTGVTVTSDVDPSDLVEQATIEARGGADTHVVRVKFPRSRWGVFRRGESVRVSVVVPHGTDLSVRAASADVDATGDFGRVDVETASGSVTVDEGTDVRLQTASGDLSVGTAATAELRSVSGDVVVGTASRSARLGATSGSLRLGTSFGPATLDTLSGSIEVDLAENGVRTKTVSGDVDIRCVAAGEVTIGSVSGSATVGIPPGRTLEVDAQSLSGHVTSEIDLGGAPFSDGGGSRVVVKANTVSGDVRIVRALPPRPRPSDPDDGDAERAERAERSETPAAGVAGDLPAETGSTERLSA